MGSVLVPLGDAVLIPQYQYAVSEAAHPSRHPPSTLLRQQQHRSGTIAPRIHAPPGHCRQLSQGASTNIAAPDDVS